MHLAFKKQLTMEMTWFDELTKTPLGPLSVVVTQRGVLRILFGRARDLDFDQAEGSPPATLYHALSQLRQYLAGERQNFDLPLDVRPATPFQAEVLEACRQIPYGQVRTYADLAAAVGAPVSASRAVGMVMASNPLPLVIPCHRVVGRDGKLHGYAAPGGVESKAWLLQLEGSRLVG